ncbi:MAG TPA: RluA family pseudouridine synthase [Anaeromyxobacteraceae bacterium]|nr:RluA family pseudouridine synthase [Anaeromyxobacteraceae bacterium]
MSETRSLVAPAALAGVRLDVALTRLASELSRAQAQRLIDQGSVLLDDRRAKRAARLRGGERLLLLLPEPTPRAMLAQDLPLAVLFEDRDLLVVDKAAGMVVHPARGAPHSTVMNALVHRFGSDRQGLGLVHRLDKDTSGCLLVAKSEQALGALQASFKAREVEKRYLALCHGRLPAEGRLDTFYGRHPRDRTRFTSRLLSKRRAATAWRVLEKFPGATLAEVSLLTGRTHQIRVHLSESGHPILADATYGGTRREARLAPEDPARRAALAIGRHALHAWRLAFPHPRTGRRVAFESPPPRDFQSALSVLRGER